MGEPRVVFYGSMEADALADQVVGYLRYEDRLAFIESIDSKTATVEFTAELVLRLLESLENDGIRYAEGRFVDEYGDPAYDRPPKSEHES